MFELDVHDEVYPLRGVNVDPRCRVNLDGLLNAAQNSPLKIESVRMVPEPENPFDPLAIKVEINGLMVGYVPKDWTHSLHQRFGPSFNIPVFLYRWGRFQGHDGVLAMYCDVFIRGQQGSSHENH